MYCHIRYAKYNTVNGVEERMLYKAFGIRFDVMVFGQVGFPPPPSFFSLICLYVGDSQILDLVSLILNYKLIGASEYALGLCETT